LPAEARLATAMRPAFAKATAGILRVIQARRLVSKTGGWGFDSLLSCQFSAGCTARVASAAREHIMKAAMAEHDDKDSIAERARGSVTGWWGQSRRFLSEVRNEVGRVSWPSGKEVYATTVVVILTSIFFGVYLWGVDVVLTSIVGWIYRTLGAA
jgi:preprotein translocase subunit SecE